MKKLFIILFIASVIFGQEHPGIHQWEMEYFKNQKTTSHIGKAMNSKRLNKNHKLSQKVLGYLPDWEYLDGSADRIDYSLLSHIGLFDFTIDTTGAVGLPPAWPWNDVIDSAKANGVKLLLTAAVFDTAVSHSIISDSNASDKFFEDVETIIRTNGLDGINLDFEALLNEDKKTPVIDFISRLRNYFNSKGLDAEISFATPAVNWSGLWDLDGIAQVCDYIYILAYDFHGVWSDKTGPTAPLSGNSGYNLISMLETDYKNIVNSTPDKIILGVPYYGLHWETTSDSAYSRTTKFVFSTRYKDAVPIAKTNGLLWDSETQTPWTVWRDTVYHQLWFDNDSSLALKYDFAVSKNLGGIGIWALGYDGDRTELWKLLNDKFGGGAVQVESENNNIPVKFKLLGNYPNPFNPATNIVFELPESGEIQVSVYNLLGKRIFISQSVFYNKGKNNFELNFSSLDLNLSSGAYFYNIAFFGKQNNVHRIGKMLLLK